VTSGGGESICNQPSKLNNPMSVRAIKDAIKATPGLSRLYLSAATKYRQSRRRALDKKRDRAIERFRKFCVELSQKVAQPVFVKVGANDGIGDDPCSDLFVAHKNWRGVMIEPVPYWFEKLKANFKAEAQRFTFEQLAVGSPAGETTFYHVDPKGRERMPNWEDWFDKLGSFDRNHIIKHANGILEPFIVAAKVQVLPLTEVLARNNLNKVHLLHVDAEGFDYEVLKTLDFSKVAPLSIFIEHFHLSPKDKSEMVAFLRQQGYTVHDCISDYFAVKEDAAKQLFQKSKSK
jgi:FkbM family methyltransferase